MASTITIASSKGGAGKTTIARLMLRHALRCGYRAAAIDSDLNQALTNWIKRFSVPVDVRAGIDETGIIPAVQELEARNDIVVVDTAGTAVQATVFAIGAADLVLVPLKLSDGDMLEAVKTMHLIKSTSDMMRREIPARLVLTGFKPNALVSKHVAQEIARLGLQEMRTRLHDLVGYIDMTHSGIVPVGSAVDAQAAALFQETLELMGIAPPAEQIAVGA
jgi:chromosome partitioning protein